MPTTSRGPSRRGARSHQGGLAAVASTFPVRRWLEARHTLLASAAAMFAAIFIASLIGADTHGDLWLLYAVPIAICALELGLVGGLVAALTASALSGISMAASSVHLGAGGVIVRLVAFACVGAVGGRFGDRMRDAQRRQFLLLKSGLRLAHLDAAEDLPSELAEQARELLSCRGARVELADGEAGVPLGEAAVTVGEAGITVGGERDELPIEVRGVRYGTLAVTSARPTTLEDHAMLAILALQAAVAAENRRLLASERERALIRAELQDARVHLDERAGQLREVILRQEAERHRLAYELNEQAAQSLAAVLLGLGALERELTGGRLTTSRLSALRSDVDATLRSLRTLAVNLRPPVLMLGLQAALERLAERLRGSTFGEMSVELEHAQFLGEETETMVYRVVEEALDAVGAARLVSVRTRAEGSELVIEVEDAEHPIAQQRLAVLRARMDLVGGRLSASPTELEIVIPLRTDGHEVGAGTRP